MLSACYRTLHRLSLNVADRFSDYLRSERYIVYHSHAHEGIASHSASESPYPAPLIFTPALSSLPLCLQQTENR